MKLEVLQFEDYWTVVCHLDMCQARQQTWHSPVCESCIIKDCFVTRYNRREVLQSFRIKNILILGNEENES